MVFKLNSTEIIQANNKENLKITIQSYIPKLYIPKGKIVSVFKNNSGTVLTKVRNELKRSKST